jgi:hypothetical protein
MRLDLRERLGYKNDERMSVMQVSFGLEIKY